MTNDVKTYQVYLNLKAKNFEEAIVKLKNMIETNPKRVLKEIDEDKYKIHIVNK